jgi:hypothetical protein
MTKNDNRKTKEIKGPEGFIGDSIYWLINIGTPIREAYERENVKTCE